MKRLLLIVFLSVLVWSPPTQAAGERITDFRSQVQVSRNNVLDVTETIDYDFAGSYHHGIYRVVPTKYPTASGKNYFIKLAFVGATVDGHSVQVQKDNSKTNYSLRLGDPDKTITGQHQYVIHYQLSPVIVQTEGKDFLTLDITGDDWEVPIEKASTTLKFEGDPRLTQLHCYAGPAGSTDENGCDIQANENLIATADPALPPGSGLSITAVLPNGYVGHYLQASDRAPLTAGEIWGIIAGIAGGLIGLAVLFVLAGRSWRQRRRRGRQTVVAQYEPPDAMAPGEIGLLEDDSASITEITATLIDLAVRGYIRIEQTQKKGFLKKAKYRLHMVKDYSDAQPYERSLLDTLFAGSDAVDIDKIDRTKMSAKIESIRKQLKDRLTTKGFYGKMRDQHGLWDKAVDTGAVTDEGAAEWAKVEGLKLYLSVAEKDRLNFTDAPERTPERFNKLLPFAVALGVEREWAKQFEGIDVARDTTWYYGTGSFTAFSLSSDISSSFAGAVSSNFVQTSSTSGGSSGGGFGGGGGGSW